MEGVAAKSYKHIKHYWRRNKYERIIDGSGRKKRVQLATLGSSPSTRKKPFWRVKIKRKLKFFKALASPKKLLKSLRDAYVRMMMNFANTRVSSSGFVSGSNGYGYGSDGFGSNRGLKEYDERMIIEIYKSLMAQQQLMVPLDIPRHTAKVDFLPTIVESAE
ncbi:hypothetical protein GIB67_022979 [Kingdonia uniflora]|uniref:Uncharacterized protein n=1 Tax=Kingdonia uniflora TaxID=39325 RepID=A0A7J7P2Q9_9MAGN|nr:hypothetical protein GIB67_022979 [Kingdonia uniflora]